MSYSLLRFVRCTGAASLRITNTQYPFTLYLLPIHPNNYCIVAHYSRRSDSKNLESAFKVVKSKVRVEGK